MNKWGDDDDMVGCELFEACVIWQTRAEAVAAERDRLRELLKKYINHVGREEGTTFMPSEYDGFSAEEVEALEALDAEAAKEAGQ